jgi:NAD-dependent DNA ligase/DNA polymerase/3'-5' exonuclease PolX
MSYNEKFIEILEKLSNIMLKKGEAFRARAYQKAQEFIMSYPNNITSLNELKGKPNIGPAVLEKLEEFINTGSLQIIEREKNNPVNVLSDVYGIGPKKAQELVEQGITTIEQLRAKQNQLLNDTQIVGLKYYEDILKRIPRQEIECYNTLFKGNFMKNASSNYEIVGSYRRRAENSGDIDVIITSDSAKNFITFIDTLIKQKIIIEVLSRGPSKCLVIARITPSSIARRVDFLYTSKEEYPFSILYFTGSKIFNTIMRNQALTMGLTMNEHGLYKMENKIKTEKVNHHFESEQDIFKYLNIEYREPWERTDSRAFKEITEKKALPEKKKLIIEEDPVNEVFSFPLFINNFKKNGTTPLNNLSANDFINILRELTKAYHNQTPLLTDIEYDIIKDYFEIKYPTSYSSWSKEIGAPVEQNKNKATLPYEMGSMDKIKPDTNVLLSWTKKFKGPYVLSCKLDGVSGLYSTEGKSPKLYTRGDGKVGQDISYLIPYLNLPKNKNLVIRGEFIISKNVFETKYKNEFANPRNMVAGIINHKTVDKNKISDVHFVAYEVIKPILDPSEQMEFLRNDLKTECVLNRLEKTISNELLSQILIDNRRMYDYEIDGIIVTNNQIYERKSGNPEHAFAFKMVLSEQLAEATVVDVIWSPSKDGYLKPRVQILPINLGGVKIEYATGFNGAFIQNNKIGIGAVIQIVRSGDVIPHILSVTTPAQEPKMPTQSYKWNATNVDIILENMEQDETVREKNITCFFKGIEVEGLGSGNISRIIEAGFDTVPKIINMTTEDFLKVEGFKSTMANKIYNGIKEKTSKASLITLMSASNLFGRTLGEKKIELIMNDYPDILISKETNSQKIQKVLSVKGIAEKSATIFVESIETFKKFIKECGLENKFHNQPFELNVELKADSPLYNKTIIMTGFRDKNLEDKIKNAGAKLGSSVSKNTFVVIVKHVEEDTSKASDAKKLGVPLITVEDFNNKYF